MQSIVLKDGFGINMLTLQNGAIPQPNSDEILVRMKAASLNYVDLLLVKGELDPAITPPFIPLSDGAGVVEAVGTNISNFKPGDHVVTTYIPEWIDGRYTPENSKFQTRPGTGSTPGQLSEYKTFRENGLIKFPGYLSFAGPRRCRLPH